MHSTVVGLQGSSIPTARRDSSKLNFVEHMLALSATNQVPRKYICFRFGTRRVSNPGHCGWSHLRSDVANFHTYCAHENIWHALLRCLSFPGTVACKCYRRILPEDILCSTVENLENSKSSHIHCLLLTKTPDASRGHCSAFFMVKSCARTAKNSVRYIYGAMNHRN